MSEEHLGEAAFYGALVAPPDATTAACHIIAEVVTWIYVVDDVLDRDLAQMMRDDPARADSFLAALMGPASRLLSTKVAHRSGLPRGVAAATEAVATEAVQSSLAGLLRDADETWCEASGPEQGAESSRRVAFELMRCVATMRQELLWNNALAAQRALPSVEDYLRNGEVSIGMFAVAASVAALEKRPAGAWREAGIAMQAAGRVIRLANDIGTWEPDIAAGKLSIISLLAAQRKARRHAISLAPDALFAQVRADAARAYLRPAIERFAKARRRLSEGPLRYYLTQIVSFALAVYGDGAA
jgi:hypothetical protein